ncbi:hypothetical protein [Poriferisphaera sp. WC338]|uniref:hypothetical protein n=1 Tax=Poriferisphaera sp. WC338 TaxID=3425129 RepID=UPI003D81446D
MSEKSREVILDELNKLERVRRQPSIDACQRQFERYVVRGEAELHPMNRTHLEATPITVQLRDLGRGGAGFISQQPISLGSSWRMCFLQHGYVIGSQPIIARHSHRVDNDLYLIGSQFVIETGLMTLLGIDPIKITQTENDITEDLPNANFLPPADVA